MNFPNRAALNVAATLRVADARGVKVLGLGALNKAEFVNKSGAALVQDVKPNCTRVVHGNTLTAAVVVENILSVIAEGGGRGYAGVARTAEEWFAGGAKAVFLTGPTSKVGRASVLQLLKAGVNVVCLTSSLERFLSLRAEAERLGLLRKDGAEDGTGACMFQSAEMSDGVWFDLWVVGKYDVTVQDHVPMHATAVVFSVPCPLSLAGGESVRDDVRVVDGGLLRLDQGRCSTRTFPILLANDCVYACHAAAIVHHKMGGYMPSYMGVWRHMQMHQHRIAHARTCPHKILHNR